MKVLIKKLIGFARSTLRFAENIWVTRVYLALLTLSIGYCLYKYWGELDIKSQMIRGEMIAAVFLLSYIAYFFYVYIHYSSYRKLGVDISFWQTFQVASVSRLGVYVPGKIWAVTNYYIFSRCFGIPADTIGKNFIINNALLLFTGALMSFLVITKLNTLTREFLFVLPALMLILIHPRVLNSIFSFLIPILQGKLDSQSVNKQDIETFNWSYYTYLQFIALYLVLWMIGGIILFLCIKSFGVIGFSSIPVILAAGAVSLVIALLALFAPAGVGIREGVGIFIVAQVVPMKTAILAFILLRLSQIIVDLSVGIIGAVQFMRIRKKELADA